LAIEKACINVSLSFSYHAVFRMNKFVEDVNLYAYMIDSMRVSLLRFILPVSALPWYIEI